MRSDPDLLPNQAPACGSFGILAWGTLPRAEAPRIFNAAAGPWPYVIVNIMATPT